jgi:HAE1 family hydrophobic/amphiphilic exporter-1
MRTVLILWALVWAGAARAITPDDVIGHETTISLEEAIELALANNLDLQVARVDPALSDQQVREASGSFDPLLFAESTYEDRETPFASPFQSAFGTQGQAIDEKAWLNEAGVRGLFPWGIEYSSTYDRLRTETTSGVTALFPEFRGTWRNQLTVPLLKDLFQNDAYLAVRSSRIGAQISEEDFRQQLTDIVVRVEAAYWELAAARAAKRVAEKSVDTALNLLEQTRVRHQVGVVSRVEVTEAEAGLADREFQHIQARNRAERAEDELLQQILAPDQFAYQTTSIQTQEPTFIDYQVDERLALERALGGRPEIEAARQRVEDADLRLDHAWNQKLPTLDVTGSYTVNGLSGDQRFPPGTVLNPGVDSDSDGFPDNLQVQRDLGFEHGGRWAGHDFFDWYGWGIGATFSYPLGNETAQSRYVQRKIEHRRVTTDLHRVQQQVILDVRNAVRAVQDSRDGVRAAERRKASEAERLRAEQERLRLGDSTPQQVLEIEEDFAEAERQEINALQIYRTSITALERAQATLLESRAISFERELTRE